MKTIPSLATLISLAALGALGLTAGAGAQEEIDETAKVKSDVRVEVENISGSVVVVGWDRDEVKITGTLGHGTERLDVDASPERVRIEVVLPRRARNVEETDLEIHMPAGGSLEVKTVSADAEATGLTGEVYLETVSGDVELGGSPAEADAETVSGQIELTVDSDEVRAESVSGGILITRARGALAAETVSGEILIEGGVFTRLDAQTVSGDIRLTGGFSRDGVYRFESHSGSVELWLPEDTSADFEISTYSGEIDSDFGGRPRRTGKYTPGEELDLTTGGGGASVRIDTFSGDVELRTR